MERLIESYSEFNNLRLILEKRGLLDILAPDLGQRVEGGRAGKAYAKAIENLKKAGFEEVANKSTTSQSSGNVNNSLVFEHPDSPIQVVVYYYIGYSARDNRFSYSIVDKPVRISIKSESDYKTRLSYYGDLGELQAVINNRGSFGDSEHIQTIRQYLIAELKALAEYAAGKVNVKRLVKLGPGLIDDKEFIALAKERDCEVKKNYLGNSNQIRVELNWKSGKFTSYNLAGVMGLDFVDGRVGYAYVKLDDASDVDYMIRSLLTIPPIF